MTIKYDDPVAVFHGKITEKPLRKKPSFPSWAMKMIMAVTGLMFGLFLLVHMLGNMKIFQGKEAINSYAIGLRTFGEPILPYEGLLWIVRIVLLVAIVLHIYCAFALTRRSRQSRGQFRRKNKVKNFNNFGAQSMLVTGIVLLCFIIFHILDLTLGAQPAASSKFEHLDAYSNLINSFSRPGVAVFYIIAMVVMFLHLSHGIVTAASDLGVTGHRWRQIFLWISYILPALVMIGNIAIPVAVLTGVIVPAPELSSIAGGAVTLLPSFAVGL